jgi:hypothetical protein
MYFHRAAAIDIIVEKHAIPTGITKFSKISPKKYWMAKMANMAINIRKKYIPARIITEWLEKLYAGSKKSSTYPDMTKMQYHISIAINAIIAKYNILQINTSRLRIGNVNSSLKFLFLYSASLNEKQLTAIISGSNKANAKSIDCPKKVFHGSGRVATDSSKDL